MKTGLRSNSGYLIDITAKSVLLSVLPLLMTASLLHAEVTNPPTANAPSAPIPYAGSPSTGTSDSQSMQGAASVPTKLIPPPTPTQITATPPSLSNPPPTTASIAVPEMTLKDSETKVPASIKSVIKHLDSSNESMTLGDLNSARQAIARVEMLIELERKLAELEKIRDERTAKLAPPVLPISAGPMPGQPGGMPGGMPSFVSSSNVDIIKVFGAAGRYKAVLKSGFDSSKTVEVGDKLSDGSVVKDIDPMGVVIDNKGEISEYHIKNVDRVYGGSP